MILSTPEGAWRVETPRLDPTFGGSGDLTAATFLAQWLRFDDPASALGETAAIVYAVLKATADSGQRELQLVAAQDELVAPSERFEVTRLA
jgi:pyridoxine kinase